MEFEHSIDCTELWEKREPLAFRASLNCTVICSVISYRSLGDGSGIKIKQILNNLYDH